MQDALARMRQSEGDRTPKRKESEERSEDVKRQKVSPTERQKKPAVTDVKVSNASGDLDAPLNILAGRIRRNEQS
jgi:hypothetical protein